MKSPIHERWTKLAFGILIDVECQGSVTAFAVMTSRTHQGSSGSTGTYKTLYFSRHRMC